MTEPRHWWATGVVYQIYPRSFLDTDGDGIGDLDGIRRRLDYLQELGVDAIWLSPIFPSPMADFGYDVADYCGIDPTFGTLDDFDRLLAEAHARDIRVLLDFVGNHTSDRHPWFVESRASRTNPKRDWYIWRDGKGDAPPNNWVGAFSNDPAWTYDDATGQWYLHLFLPQQPDLNWSNRDVEEAMHDVLRFWLDRGVDGFRADVIHLIGKDPAFADEPPERAAVSRVRYHDEPVTHDLLRRIRSVLDGYPGDRMMVGEVNLTEGALIASYYGEGDELHLAFNFVPLHAPWDAAVWRTAIAEIERVYTAADAWPTWVLSNHDNARHRTRYGSEARARAAAVLLLTLRGTPFLYAGEELGLQNADVPPDRVVDPGGRDGCRAPIPWDRSATHGWASEEPWLPWPPQPADASAESQHHDDESMLNLYRRLLVARRTSDALHGGGFAFLETPQGVVGYVRAAVGDERAILVNFTGSPVDVPLDRDWTVEVSTHRDSEGRPFGGTLAADQAVVLR